MKQRSISAFLDAQEEAEGKSPKVPAILLQLAKDYVFFVTALDACQVTLPSPATVEFDTKLTKPFPKVGLRNKYCMPTQLRQLQNKVHDLSAPTRHQIAQSDP